MGFPGGSDGKKSVFSVGDLGSIPRSGRSAGEGNDYSLQYLSGEFHGQRSLSGYSPWGCKESDTTEPTFQKCGPSSFLTWLPYGQTQPSNWTELNWWSENAVSAFSFKLAETSFMALYMDRLCQHFECAWEECSFLILITGYGTFYVGIQSRL